ncbi:hypothetical protein LCGC14_2612370 [marine sediment metagenome]|uniref:Uncharacterized protein n=1 Tax=marine sediment metagenome TaxID=412755 RepID=A0A0F9A5R4_9ZZZZ
MKNTKQYWKELIKANTPLKYKYLQKEVSLRMDDDESYWNGHVFHPSELTFYYDSEDLLGIHYYRDDELIDTIFATIN